jgi:uncharacterized protein (DUF427 family)
MAKVLLNGKVIAESNDTIKVEGNHYFPIESINKDLLVESNLTTACPWKGKANYYNLSIEGNILKDKVWYYANPSDAAKEIKNRIAFYQRDGISVVED